MALTCGLIGLPTSGKSTLFALLAGSEGAPAGKSGEIRRLAPVPDERVDTLGRQFRPEKIIHARLEVIDIPGLVPGERSRTAHFLEGVRGSDALIFVLRGFEIPGAAAPDPVAELDTLQTELIFADLAMVEGRIGKLEDGKGLRKPDVPLHTLLCRLREAFEEGTPLRSIPLTGDEQVLLAHTQFLSSKPVAWVLNVGEGELGTAGEISGLPALAKEQGAELAVISAQVEREIADLPPDDAQLFLDDLGLTEPGTARVARAVYERLGLISFFTVGEDEVRAWTITRGTRAREAAGKIHSDMERGFIRAEVIPYADYLKTAEDVPDQAGPRVLTAAREQGLMRLEGKDYEVVDGDILTIRFNV